LGLFYGANIISVGITYGLHNESKLFCIDQWEDYEEYDEYKMNNHIFMKHLLKILKIQDFKIK
jgi:hypothetical protein